MKTDLLQLVMDGMKWEKEHAQLWFNTKNTLFFGMTPNGYELLRGHDKLEKIIRQMLDENKMDDQELLRLKGEKNG